MLHPYMNDLRGISSDCVSNIFWLPQGRITLISLILPCSNQEILLKLYLVSHVVDGFTEA